MQQKINAVSDWTYSSRMQSVRQSGRHTVAVQAAGVASCPSRTTCWLCGFQNPAVKWEPAHLYTSSTSSPLQVAENHFKVGQVKTKWSQLKGSSFGAKCDKNRLLNFFFCFRFPLMLGASLITSHMTPEFIKVSATCICVCVCIMHVCQRKGFSFFSYHNSHGIQRFS